MVEPLAFDEAAALMAALRSGSACAGEIPDPPVILVDLGSRTPAAGNSKEPLQPPAIWPCVVVAVSSAAHVVPAGADVYVTDAPAPGRPWVGGLGDLDRLVAAVTGHPQASTTLAQVLRAHSGDVERDLLTESIAYSALQGGADHRGWLESNPRPRAGEDRSPAVAVSRSGDRLDVVLDRPARHNAYSAAMRDGLVAALELAATDPAIKEVHLSGNGPSFCSGGDLSEFGEVPDPATAHTIRMSRSAAYHVSRVASRLVAHVHGACVGAGVELASFAARVLADPGTTFRLPEVGMGLIPGAGGTASIPRRIGRHRTAWLALAGTEVSAETALAWGLVDEMAAARAG